ncbi:Abnormal spindle-like microcephaly-assoc'd, ASPM-SPD-2-Hydin [Bryocella elongata]|uniref:Abnormal spindle-like microcephaly-assoc'd, ASPM-SPD-2-Hydin n=1 Tax=Bryocella elongata TaxID=863522 RepID=A0A1H5S2L6_9BACT|nr:choice-of-anchor D domain-containing protein [Bryocella elongata]SEF44852.1 Abnormal spindle-like microcephaly-assoc'd, ASPM-SPD-2-Hydin [Bryocella elongata]
MNVQSSFAVRQALLRCMVTLAALMGLLMPQTASAGTVLTSPVVVQLPATAVGNSSSGVVETVTLTGFTGSFSFQQHYARDYYFSGPTCNGTGTVTCTLTVYFRPTLPGIRKEAIFVMNGSTRIGTILLSGVGTAPLAAFQPGVVTLPTGLAVSSSGYVKDIVTDENGVVYFYNSAANSIQSCLPGCTTPTTLVSNVGTIFNLSIDGAGVLYWGMGGNSAALLSTINTYDTVQSLQGTITMPASDQYYNTAVDGMGDVFAVGASTNTIYKLLPTGSSTTAALNPPVTSAYFGLIDSAGDYFIGGSSFNELTAAGSQSQISTLSTANQFGMDAADTLYLASGTVPTELASSNYNSSTYSFSAFSNVPITGLTSSTSGTLYFGTLGGAYKIDRTQDTIAFGSQTEGATAATQTVNMLNIGNSPLNLSNIALSGTGYALQTAATNPCTAGIMLAPGASCNIAVNFESPNAGNYPGSIVVTSNSLNNNYSTETITLSAFINGAYLVASPATVSFNPQTIATSSTAQTITITNNGYGGPATLSNLASTSPDFTVAPSSSGGCGATLAVNASCNLSLTFTPTAPQAYTGAVSITGNEGSSTPASVASIPVTGNGLPGIVQTGGSNSNNVLIFNSAAVGIAPGSAQSLTATYTITGYSSSITPVATLHTGTSYSAGQASCTGPVAAVVCTVTVQFTPKYPGARKDAIFLTVNGTRIATTLLDGVGQAPLALMQPGIITTPILNNSNYLYNSVVDENGTVYIALEGANSILRLTTGGVTSTLPITGLNSPRGIGIDGAGVLYIADQSSNGFIKYYDTVQGLQGTINVPGTGNTLQSLTTGNTGDVYATDSSKIYTIFPNGTGAATVISPSITQASGLVVDSSEDVFIGGYSINELQSGGTQSQITPNGNSGIGIDAANTVYVSRDTNNSTYSYSVGLLPASNYLAPLGGIDAGGYITGNPSVGPDGTVYVGDYTNLDKVDRSQGAVNFGSMSTSTPSTSTLTLYNGGNQALTLATVGVSGAIFTLSPASSNSCSNNMSIAPGALCNILVTATPTHAGSFTGAVTFITNSLNTTATTQTVALSGYVNGVYVTPNPTTLTFGNQAVGTSSTPQNITLTNSGVLYTAGIGGFNTNAGFTVNASNCSSGLAPGGSCALAVTFTPTAAQAYTNVTFSASVGSNGGGPNQTVSFTASGTGFTPQLSVVPTALSYAATVGTTSPPQNALVTNIGTTTITNLALSLTGTNSANFTQTATTCTTTLAPGASCTATITFTPPGTAGPYTAAFTATGGASTASTPLTGTGNAFIPIAQLQFTPAALTQFAGTGAPCSRATLGGGDGGPATAASFCTAFGTSVDPSGNVYITDSQANDVRKVTPAGIISSYAGVANVAGSSSGDGGPAAAAGLNFPVDTIFDPLGNGYIVDLGNARMRKVTANNGNINTLYGPTIGFFNGTTGTLPIGDTGSIAFDPSGNMYLAGGYSHLVIKITPAGSPSIFAGTETNSGPGLPGYTGDGGPAYNATLNNPQGVASDLAGNIYIADTNNNVIRRVSAATGIISTYAGTGTLGYTGDGGAATSAQIGANYVSTDLAGDVYVMGMTTQPGYAGEFYVVRKVTPSGTISTFAGSGSGGVGAPANTASFASAIGISRPDLNGNLIIPNYTNVYSVGGAGLLAFGTQTLNTSAVQTLTIENTGNTPLVFGSTPYILTGSSEFTVTSSTCTGSLAIAATCAVQVTFTPTTATSATASLAFSSNAQGGTETASLTGTGAAASAALAVISPASPFSFANTSVGLTTPQVFVLSNPGNAALNVGAIAITGGSGAFTLNTACANTTIAPNGSCNIMVSFSPGAALMYSGSLSVSDNATGSPQTVALSGTGTAPNATLTASLAFGNQALGTTSATQIATLMNSGNDTLTISSIVVTGTNAQAFPESTTCGSSLTAGASCSITVAFAPTIAGGNMASVTVTDNASSGTTQSVALSGTGTAPGVSLTGSLAFGNQLVGTSSATQMATLTNTGTTTLTISSIAVSGTNAQAFPESTTCGGSLAAGSSCTITVGFSPTASGANTAMVTVTDNAASGTTQTIALTGTGTAPNASLTSALSFGNQPVGSTSGTQMATLSNTGTATLTISGIVVGGANASVFPESTTCGSSLTAGSSCTISFAFAPTATGADVATLTVTDNASSATTQMLALSGTGTAPNATLTSSLTFSAQPLATTSATQMATLTNTGTATLTISGIVVSGANAGAFPESSSCGATLAPSASCTITLAFAPTVLGANAAVVTVSDNAPTPQQTVMLSGTATAALIPIASLTPASLTFASTPYGTSDPTQTLTLSNTGTGPMTISSIAIGGANASSFTQTNNCGATLAASAMCSITVTFTPAAGGALTASLNVTDNASGSPQSSALSGTGTIATDFSVAAAPPSVTVVGGSTASYTFTVTSINGTLASPVTLTATSLPGATITFSPASVSPGSGSATSVMTVQTTSALAALEPWRIGPAGPIALALMSPLFFMRRRFPRTVRRKLTLLSLFVLLGAAVTSLSGCGGGFALPSRTYTISVTGASSTTTHTTTVNLTVQ